jgi:hypothetical protein
MMGLYNIILAIYFDKDFNIVLVIVDFVLYMLLDIGFISVRLKNYLTIVVVTLAIFPSKMDGSEVYNLSVLFLVNKTKNRR